jgi:hypothetical protein
MPRASTARQLAEPQPQPAPDRIAPSSQGTYAIYDTPQGGYHLAYRPAGAQADEHLEIPPFIVKMARNAAEGKMPIPGPLGKLMQKSLAKER